MFSRILVPLDGSELSESAIPYVEELAGALNSEIELLYVCEPGESQYRHMHELYVQKIAEQVRNHIKAYPDRKPDLTASVKTKIIDGEPAAEIIDYAANNEISLIVMASHGRSGIMPWTMGSIATKVTEKISRPVMFIRADTARPKADRGEIFSKVLVPLDGSEAGEAAISYVKELARRIKTEVTLLQVVEPGQHVHTIGGLGYVPFPEQEIDSLKEKSRKYLKKISRRLANTKATIVSEVKTGNAAQEIIKFANETDTRLVAFATHGHSGIGYHGSITRKVLQAGHKPILLVRAPGVKS